MLIEEGQGKVGVSSSKKRVSRKPAPSTGVVTDRDAEALGWILDQGVMTADQIFRAVYNRGAVRSSRHAYARLQFLQQVGLIVPVQSPHRKHRFLKITKQGQAILFNRNLPNVTRVLSVPSISEIPHAEALTEIRIAIQESGKHGNGLWWRSEGQLAEDEEFPKERFRDLMPDAIWITKSSRLVAIEFERARKGITRVRKKVEGFELELSRPDRAFERVLWVSLEGAYRDLKKALGNRETQILRTIPELMIELKGEA